LEPVTTLPLQVTAGTAIDWPTVPVEDTFAQVSVPTTEEELAMEEELALDDELALEDELVALTAEEELALEDELVALATEEELALDDELALEDELAFPTPQTGSPPVTVTSPIQAGA
jgi:uncharacterized Zn finger protein